MSNDAQEQFDNAVKSLIVAESALTDALRNATNAPPTTPADRWAPVRALQAQAQLHILHAISYDLSEIRDALPDALTNTPARPPELAL